MQEEINHARPDNARSPFLSLLCILTFVGSGIMLITFLIIGLSQPLIISMQEKPEFQIPGIELVINTPNWAFYAGAFLYNLSFLGALLMWKLKLKGFHLYTLAQFGLVFLSSFAMLGGGLPLGEILMSASFILFYAMNIRSLH